VKLSEVDVTQSQVNKASVDFISLKTGTSKKDVSSWLKSNELTGEKVATAIGNKRLNALDDVLIAIIGTSKGKKIAMKKIFGIIN
jgi:hypothetical protein